jgi:hypothetical protein
MKFGWMTLSLSPSPDDDPASIDQHLEQAVLAEAAATLRRAGQQKFPKERQ